MLHNKDLLNQILSKKQISNLKREKLKKKVELEEKNHSRYNLICDYMFGNLLFFRIVFPSFQINRSETFMLLATRSYLAYNAIEYLNGVFRLFKIWKFFPLHSLNTNTIPTH